MRNAKESVWTVTLLFMLLAPFQLARGQQLDPKEVQCLTDNIYWEAQGEPLMGQVWVAGVVLERVRDERWPSTVCGVIYQDAQFSWTAHEQRAIRYKDAYRLAQNIAEAALEGRIDVPKANHYLRCDWKEKPHTFWWKKMKFVGQLGDHCFFYY